MSDQRHDDYQLMLGAHTLGALGAADRARLERHLSECADCRRELAEMAVVPGLLARISPPHSTESHPSEADRPAPDRVTSQPAIGRAMAEVRTLRGRERRRTRILRSIAAAAVVVALAGGIGIGTLIPRTPAGSATVAGAREMALTGTGRSASVALTPKPWGTELQLTAQGLPAQRSVQLVVVSESGASQPTATWQSPGSGPLKVTGAAAMQSDTIRQLQVRDLDGTVLLSSG